LIAKLGTTDEDRNDRTEILLEELLYIIEQIDMAQVFVKFGGVKSLILTAKEIENVSTSNRAAAIAVIGSLAQNNITVQVRPLRKRPLS